MVHRVLLALVVVAACASSHARAARLDGWYPCEASGSAQSASSVQCAIFRAPLCYDGVCRDGSNRTLDVFVKRLAASTARSSSTPKVIIVQGGPSGGVLDYEAAMRSISTALDGQVEIYSLDRRGSGRSTKLDCVAAQAQTITSPGGVAISPDEVASCADELASKYPSGLSAFSLTSAAYDVQYFVTKFLNSTGPTFAYGAGSNSPIVERLIHLNTSDVFTGYILDGVATTSGSSWSEFAYESKWDEAYDAVGQQFLALCDSDPQCNKYFPNATVASTLRSIIDSLAARMPTSDCTVALEAQLANAFGYEVSASLLPAQAFRWVLGELLRSATLRKFIPVVAYRLTRCSRDDTQVLEHFFSTLRTMFRASGPVDTFRVSLLAKMTAFSESWETPAPSAEVLETRLGAATITTGAYAIDTYCTFTKDNSSACARYAASSAYSAPPLAYARDKYWNTAARPPKNASVLVLSGTLDPVTPHMNAETLVAVLNTTNKRLVAFEHATHGALWNTLSSGSPTTPTCGVAIVASYVRNDGDLSKTATTCVASVPKLSFAIEPSLVTTWLNAASAYDGAYSASPSGAVSTSPLATPYKLAVIALCVLLGLAVILGCVVVSKWRRSRKRRLTFDADESIYDACPN